MVCHLVIWGSCVWGPFRFSNCVIQGKCCQFLWYVILLCWPFGHPPTYFCNMSYHATVLTFFFMIEVFFSRCHMSLSRWGKSSLLSARRWAKEVATILVIWLLCLKFSSCWSEFLFVTLISYGGLCISLLLLFVEGHLRGECMGGICMV